MFETTSPSEFPWVGNGNFLKLLICTQLQLAWLWGRVSPFRFKMLISDALFFCFTKFPPNKIHAFLFFFQSASGLLPPIQEDIVCKPSTRDIPVELTLCYTFMGQQERKCFFSWNVLNVCLKFVSSFIYDIWFLFIQMLLSNCNPDDIHIIRLWKILKLIFFSMHEYSLWRTSMYKPHLFPQSWSQRSTVPLIYGNILNFVLETYKICFEATVNIL